MSTLRNKIRTLTIVVSALGAACVLALAGGVPTAGSPAAVYAEESTFTVDPIEWNAAKVSRLGTFLMAYGEGNGQDPCTWDEVYFDNRYWSSGTRSCYWVTRLMLNLLETSDGNNACTVEQFTDLAASVYTGIAENKDEWENDFQVFFAYQSENNSFTYDADTGIVTLISTSGAKGSGAVLEMVSSDLTDGTGTINCAWKENETVLQECVITLKDNAIVSFLPKEYTAGDYTYEIVRGEVMISDYKGAGGAIEIPEKVDGLSVTSIKHDAFQHKGLTSVVIPESVTEIGSGAFAANADLVKFNIPSGVTKIEHQTFYGAGLTELTIPGNVKTIDYGAFLSCRKLAKVTFEKGVEEIGSEAFNVCESLTEVSFPEGLKSIGGLAFDACPLTEVTIPGSVETIGSMAFITCRQLKTVRICEGVTAIGDFNFSTCESLTKVVLPASLKTIAMGAFYNCQNISEVWYGGTAASWEEVVIQPENDALTKVALKYGDGTVVKKANTLKATGKTVALKASTLKKKAQTITKAKAFTISKAKGTVSFKLVSVTKSKFKKYFRVTSAGKITVKKGLKKGTYRVKVKVTAAGTAGYKSGYKNATVTVRVK